jgi:hypothetical protein
MTNILRAPVIGILALVFWGVLPGEAQHRVIAQDRSLPNPQAEASSRGMYESLEPAALWSSGVPAASGVGWSGLPAEQIAGESLSLFGEHAGKDRAADLVQPAGYDELLFEQNQLTDQLSSGRLPGHTLTPTVPAPGETPWLRWKSTSFMATWLPGSGDDYGVSDLSARVSLSSPRIPFVSATPNYQMTILDGPNQTDVSSTLHRASVSFMGMLPLSQRFIAQAIVTPGIASDYQNMSSQAFRTTGMGFLIFMPSPQLQWMFGVVYLDREDVSLLPAVGLTWSPNDRTKLELIFPRPRLMRMISEQGDRSQWAYLAAEFGGGSWAIERTDGSNDIVTLRDYRLLAGLEYKMPAGRSWFYEGGLVIGREIEYVSGVGDFRQDPTILLRAGVTF